MEKCVLLCIAHAGGSAMSYYQWKEYFDKALKVYPLELPGRGKKIKQGLCVSAEELIDRVWGEVLEVIDKKPFALFGHSMGGILAFKLAQRLEKQGMFPRHLFLSATPLGVENMYQDILKEDDYNFMREVQKIGVLPEIVFKNEKFFNTFEPIIRADFQIVNSCSLSTDNGKIKSNFSLFYGNEDLLLIQKGRSWDELISGEGNCYYFKGNHFFLFDNVEKICSIIRQTLA